MEKIEWQRQVTSRVDEYVSIVINGGSEPRLWLSFPCHNPDGPTQIQHVIPYEKIQEFADAVGRAAREAKYRHDVMTGE